MARPRDRTCELVVAGAFTVVIWGIVAAVALLR
ncbi:hypothetical protein BH10PSE14_BH10PSE14_02400 [soil metagenome]